jgi:hypothetical protein
MRIFTIIEQSQRKLHITVYTVVKCYSGATDLQCLCYSKRPNRINISSIEVCFTAVGVKMSKSEAIFQFMALDE